MINLIKKFIRYTFYTINAYMALLLILLIIVILTPGVFLFTILFDKQRILYLFLTRFFIKTFFRLNFISLKKRIDFNQIGPPEKNQKRIYVLTHNSLIDGLLLFLMPGQIKFMAGEFYAKIPIFGLGISLTGNISVKKKNRYDGQQMDMILQAEEILDQGYPLALFPEGHRSRNGKIGRFQNSAFMLALEKKAEIIPVVLDTWNILRPDSFIVRDHNFTVKFLSPIPYKDFKTMNYKELSQFVKSKMIKAYLEIIAQKKNQNPNYYWHHPNFTKINQEMTAELKE